MMVSRPVMEQMPQVMAMRGLEDRPCTNHGVHGGHSGAETGLDTMSSAAWAASVTPASMYEHVWIPPISGL